MYFKRAGIKLEDLTAYILGTLLHKIELTPAKDIQSLVENRRVFNLNNCELNIYESYKQAYRVPLKFSDLMISSMMRGKKVMHLIDKDPFVYVPGETVIMPANEPMIIDFPESESENPTQCIALTVNADYVNDTVDYLNEYYNGGNDEQGNWTLQFNQYHFSNDNEVSDLINRIIRICSGPDRKKNVYADLNLKELLIRLIQGQHLFKVSRDSRLDSNMTKLHFVLNYIQEHLSEKIPVDVLCRKAYLSRNQFFRWFREQSGFSPLQYINIERVKLAKQILADPRNNLQTASMLSGFSDVNYFVRVFKKIEGITPGVYQSIREN